MLIVAAVLVGIEVPLRLDAKGKLLPEERQLEVFRSVFADSLAELSTAFATSNGPKAARSAHTRKGMIGFFEAAEGVRAAIALEEAALSGVFVQTDAAFGTLTAAAEEVMTLFSNVAKEESDVPPHG